MKQFRIILASASPRRKELLNQIGIFPEIMPSDLEEHVTSLIPSEVVEQLSRQKADSIWGICNNCGDKKLVVIGSDTVVSAGGRILGKPKDEAEAADMIGVLAGGSHQVYTGVTLVSAEKSITFSEKTDVSVYPMTETEIREYISCGESMDKAGAYGIQGRFAAYIEKIEGSYANVMGLPVGRVYQELKQLMEEHND